MCGIVGYVGEKEAYPIIIKGLNRLVYRGYDSAGIALLIENKLSITKSAGKVEKLEEKHTKNLEKALEGSSADVDGSEGKFSANIVFDGFNGLNTIKRHK